MECYKLSRGGSRGRVQGLRIPPPSEMPCGFLIQLVWVFCINICLRHQSVTPFLSGAPRPKKNPGSPPDIPRQRGPAAEDRESFVESSYFAKHADLRVRIERDRNSIEKSAQMDINSISALYQKLKTSVSSLFLEAFKIRESRTSCQLRTDYKLFCLAIKRICKMQKSAMGSNFESVHSDCKVGGNTNHARLHSSTSCSFIIDISGYHFACLIQDIGVPN